MNKKLTDIERYLRTWQGQIDELAASNFDYPAVKVGGKHVNAREVKPLIDKIYEDVRTIVDGVKK